MLMWLFLVTGAATAPDAADAPVAARTAAVPLAMLGPRVEAGSYDAVRMFGERKPVDLESAPDEDDAGSPPDTA